MPVPYDKLYPKQKLVVEHHKGPLLVLAGPGTGKTTVLTHRVARLVRFRNVLPREILAITFAKKAANEMIDRLKEFDWLKEVQPRASTLHAEAMRILGEIGRLPKFLAGDDESRRLVEDATKDLGLNLDAESFRRKIAYLKANNKSPDDIPNESGGEPAIKKLYRRYEELLTFNRAIDFGGLVLKAVRELSSPNMSSSDKTQIRHLLVDEYQDINYAMFEFIKILSKNAESLFVVGDDDQSIYSGLGANPAIMNGFQGTFQGEVETLEESTRCPEHILKGALAVVSKNPDHMGKRVCSVRGEGALIHVLYSASEVREARWIANWIAKAIEKGTVEPKGIVILCKELALATDIVAEFRWQKIKFTYWTSGGLFADPIVRDILAYVRFFVDEDDNLALRKCIGSRTGRRIGSVGIDRLRCTAQEHGCSLWDVLIHVEKYNELKRWWSHFKDFSMMMKELSSKSTQLQINKVIDLIAKEIGVPRAASVRKLKDFAQTLDEDTTLQIFLGEVDKNRGLDVAGGGAEPEERGDAVGVMSMHSSKGLTFDVVFVLGADEGIMPNPKQDICEQRRLCYVSMTRAQKELFLCHSRRRKGRSAKGFSFYKPSCFISDIPREHMETIMNL
jgi:DNA helicase-2/ATP-dependent DNA helicase PcrA